VTDNRREFLAVGVGLLAALSQRIGAEGIETRIDGQQPASSGNPSRPIATKDAPKVNLDGWQMTATEINIPAGAPPGRKHRHPGFVIGYVLEGQYSFAVNDQPPTVVKAGEMFFESFDEPGQVHSTSGNASSTQPVKFLAIVFTKKGDPVTIPG
jgi:quercetin dioxygenase-like cupin family protein